MDVRKEAKTRRRFRRFKKKERNMKERNKALTPVITSSAAPRSCGPTLKRVKKRKGREDKVAIPKGYIVAQRMKECKERKKSKEQRSGLM